MRLTSQHADYPATARLDQDHAGKAFLLRLREPVRSRPAAPASQSPDFAHHVAVDDALATVFTPPDRHFLAAGIITDQPNLSAASRRLARSDIDAPLPEEGHVGGAWATAGGIPDHPVQTLALQTRNLGRALDDNLGRVGLSEPKLGHIGLLPLRELRSGERIRPTQVVPVIDREGESEHPWALCEGAEMGVGLATGSASLGGEKLHDHGPGREGGQWREGEAEGEKRGFTH